MSHESWHKDSLNYITRVYSWKQRHYQFYVCLNFDKYWMTSWKKKCFHPKPKPENAQRLKFRPSNGPKTQEKSGLGSHINRFWSNSSQTSLTHLQTCLFSLLHMTRLTRNYLQSTTLIKKLDILCTTHLLYKLPIWHAMSSLLNGFSPVALCNIY